jgi:uncharacterized protein (TIGR03067 family)
MRIALVTLLCTLGLTAAGGIGARADDKADVKKELKKFEGAWTFETVEAGGKELPAAEFKGMTVAFEGDKYSVKKGDEVIETATLKLDPSQSPKTFDSTVTEGPNKGTVILGIYEISGDTLKVCFDPEGKKRPTEFKTASGSQTTLVVHKRANGLAKTMLPIYLKEVEAYSLAVESAPKKELELQKEPVFEWSNPVGEGLHQGAIFLWLRDGQPAALGGIFSHPVPGWKGRKVLHEFLALDRDKLLVSRPSGALNEWKPQAGLERKELTDAPPSADAPAARLVQMKKLAAEFTGQAVDGEKKRWDLRLLSTPLYRYPPAKTGVVDGALFALVSDAGTDPEVLLLIEARQKNGKTRWEYACGRFGVSSMYVQHKDKEVWSSILNGSSDVWAHDRLHLYRIYPEKIVTAEGKLLARMRWTPTEGEVVIPVEEK